MTSTRQQKVSRMLQKEMGEILSGNRAPVFSGKLVTVTEVRVTPDLGLARIYLSVFPGPGQDLFRRQIEAHSSQLRHELGNRIRHQLRIVPVLQFFLDESLDQLDNIERLLNEQARQERPYTNPCPLNPCPLTVMNQPPETP